MLPDALPQLIDTLLRLPLLEAAQLREVIQHLPDPQASAQEMLRRGWITRDQFSTLFPGPQQRPTPQETLLVGFGDDDVPPDADCDNWDLTVSDEGDKVDVSPEVEGTLPDRTEEEMLPEPKTVKEVPVLSGAASNSQFEWDLLAPQAAGDAQRRESDTEKRLRLWMNWSSKGLLVWILIVGSYFAGRRLINAASQVPHVARQEFRKAKKKTPVPTNKRRVTSPRIAVAKADKVPNNKAAAGNLPVPIDLPPQPAVPVREPAAAPVDEPVAVIPPPQAAPQQPLPSAPSIWNGPAMYPAQADPQQFPMPLGPPQGFAFQQMARTAAANGASADDDAKASTRAPASYAKVPSANREALA